MTVSKNQSTFSTLQLRLRYFWPDTIHDVYPWFVNKQKTK